MGREVVADKVEHRSKLERVFFHWPHTVGANPSWYSSVGKCFRWVDQYLSVGGVTAARQIEGPSMFFVPPVCPEPLVLIFVLTMVLFCFVQDILVWLGMIFV